MDIAKILDLVSTYLTEYIQTLVETLRNPELHFQPVISMEAGLATDLGISTDQQNVRLNSKLLGFVAISIFIGLTINQLIPNRSPGPDLTTTIILMIAIWLLYACLAHVAFKFIGGTGTFYETMSVSLQIFAALYVLSSIAAFLWGISVGLPQVSIFVLNAGANAKAFVTTPELAYFPVQFLLMGIYLPLALKRAHNLGKARSYLVGLTLVPGFILAGYGIFLSSNILLSIILKPRPIPGPPPSATLPTTTATSTTTPPPGTPTLTSTPLLPTETPTPFDTPLLPIETRTPTVTPTFFATPLLPTETPTPFDTSTPTVTPTFSPTPPFPTATPIIATTTEAKIAPPVLIFPSPGMAVGPRADFEWSWTQPLQSDEYFLIEIFPLNESNAVDSALVKNPFYSFNTDAGSNEYQWHVSVVSTTAPSEKQWSTPENPIWEPTGTLNYVTEPSRPSVFAINNSTFSSPVRSN